MQVMTQQQNRLIHELIDQSRDRVAHVRAGQRLVDVLNSPQHPLGSPLSPPEASTLVRQHQTNGHHGRIRKRAAVALAASTTQAPSPSSYAQYSVYAGSKVAQSESVHVLDRRKAVATTSSTPLAKLVTRFAAKQRQEEDASTKLLHAVAAVKGRNAFLSLKAKKADLQHLPEITNTHLAFLAFQNASTGKTTDERTRLINAATREPIRFGDAVCLLSTVANVPLAIGRNGRTMVVEDAVTGPHMVFMIADFTDPSRRDNVLMGEPFWLRVDTAQLDVGEQDEILSLLMDTQYYLGGPGSIEEREEEEEEGRDRLRRGVNRKYVVPPHASDQVFKLVTMKASVPSVEYYGDDAATREYTVETNAHIMRLAKWKFTTPRHRHSGGERGGWEPDQLVLNCSTVGLELDEFSLDYDSTRCRGVLRGSLTRAAVEPSHYKQRETCAWQVRLLQRGEPAPPASQCSQHEARSPTEKQSLEWLQRHHDRVARGTKAVDDKRSLVNKAHAAYDSVATRSNAQLLRIEHSKAAHAREYFQSRFQQVLGEYETSKVKKKKKARLPRL